MSQRKQPKEKMTELSEKAARFSESAQKVTEVCRTLDKAWSGSSLVGHAKYFFGDFEEPSTQERFNIEWGLINGVPRGWHEKSDEEVRAKIEETAGVSLDELKNLAIELENDFLETQREIVLSLSEKGLPESDTNKLENYNIRSATDIFNDIFPTKFMTRDSAAMTGHYVAPHIYYDAIARFVSNFPSEVKGFLFELEKVDRKQVQSGESGESDSSEVKKTYYIENTIILGLSEIESTDHDLTKLIQMCKELNDNYSLGNYLSCGMLIRAIIDHIPPIFEKTTFKEVVNNYGTKSFKDIISPLDETARKISDSYLHNPIRKKELLPNKTQVSFQPSMDVLLSEVIRVLNTEKE